MMQIILPLKGFAIEAKDGKMGTISDFLFDDATWRVRWLVIDCGTWLTGRKVLIHPSAIARLDLQLQQFVVSLTKAQVEGSPELAEDQPVSQQMENRLYAYYGWDPLWSGLYLGAAPGAMAGPYMAPPYFGAGLTGEAHGGDVELQGADPHLRSVDEVTGYHIHAVDGEIGHIENFMIDDADWSIHYFVVDTRNWWVGKRVLMSPLAVRSIDWFDRHVDSGSRANRSSRALLGIRWWRSIATTPSGSIATTAGLDLARSGTGGDRRGAAYAAVPRDRPRRDLSSRAEAERRVARSLGERRFAYGDTTAERFPCGAETRTTAHRPCWGAPKRSSFR